MIDECGNCATDEIYPDLDIPMIESLPKTQTHREVDLEVVDADKEVYVRTYVALPWTMHGVVNTPLISLGVQNCTPSKFPVSLKPALTESRVVLSKKG